MSSKHKIYFEKNYLHIAVLSLLVLEPKIL